MSKERDERRRLTSELLGGGPLTPEELAGDYVVRGTKQPHQPPPAPQDGATGQGTGEEEGSTAEARSEGLGAIRYGVQEGRLGDDAYWRTTVLALCDRVEIAEAYSAVHRSAVDCVGAYVDLLAHARAWAGALAEQNTDAIEKAEQELIVAIARCEG